MPQIPIKVTFSLRLQGHSGNLVVFVEGTHRYQRQILVNQTIAIYSVTTLVSPLDVAFLLLSTLTAHDTIPGQRFMAWH
jgi:hypothetical protein